MTRTDIINGLIERKGYTTYLEIGVFGGDRNFNHINVEWKIGLDPNASVGGDYILHLTSDEYFDMLEPDVRLDCIFVDGDHRAAQVLTDLRNSVRHLAKGGTLLIHDACPRAEDTAQPERPDGGAPWNGDGYHSILHARQRKDLVVQVIDTQHDRQGHVTEDAIAVIRRGRGQVADVPKEYTWAEFWRNRAEWLGLVTVDEWLAGEGA